MNKSEIKQRCKEIARESSRKEGLITAPMVMELLPNLLDSLVIDRDFILSAIDDELNKPTINPLNLFLRLFGLRIINKENAVQKIGENMASVSSYSIEEAETLEASSLICLKEELFVKASDAIAKKLGELEKSVGETEQFLKNQNAALHAQLEKREIEYSQISTDFDGNVKSVADRVQYVLSILGRDDSGSIAEQMNELLADLDLRAVWYSGNMPDALFTAYKCVNTDKRKEKPCIMCGEQIISRGVIFVLDEAAENAED